MLTLFMASATGGGGSPTFQPFCLQAFEIFHHTFDLGDGLWLSTRAQYTLKPHFMCVERLHIANLKPNKSLKFELPSSRALITQLQSKVSVASSKSIGQDRWYLYSYTIRPVYPSSRVLSPPAHKMFQSKDLHFLMGECFIYGCWGSSHESIHVRVWWQNESILTLTLFVQALVPNFGGFIPVLLPVFSSFGLVSTFELSDWSWYWGVFLSHTWQVLYWVLF